MSPASLKNADDGPVSGGYHEPLGFFRVRVKAFLKELNIGNPISIEDSLDGIRIRLSDGKCLRLSVPAPAVKLLERPISVESYQPADSSSNAMRQRFRDDVACNLFVARVPTRAILAYDTSDTNMLGCEYIVTGGLLYHCTNVHSSRDFKLRDRLRTADSLVEIIENMSRTTNTSGGRIVASSQVPAISLAEIKPTSDFMHLETPSGLPKSPSNLRNYFKAMIKFQGSRPLHNSHASHHINCFASNMNTIHKTNLNPLLQELYRIVDEMDGAGIFENTEFDHYTLLPRYTGGRNYLASTADSVKCKIQQFANFEGAVFVPCIIARPLLSWLWSRDNLAGEYCMTVFEDEPSNLTEDNLLVKLYFEHKTSDLYPDRFIKPNHMHWIKRLAQLAITYDLKYKHVGGLRRFVDYWDVACRQNKWGRFANGADGSVLRRLLNSQPAASWDHPRPISESSGAPPVPSLENAAVPADLPYVAREPTAVTFDSLYDASQEGSPNVSRGLRGSAPDPIATPITGDSLAAAIERADREIRRGNSGNPAPEPEPAKQPLEVGGPSTINQPLDGRIPTGPLAESNADVRHHPFSGPLRLYGSSAHNAYGEMNAERQARFGKLATHYYADLNYPPQTPNNSGGSYSPYTSNSQGGANAFSGKEAVLPMRGPDGGMGRGQKRAREADHHDQRSPYFRRPSQSEDYRGAVTRSGRGYQNTRNNGTNQHHGDPNVTPNTAHTTPAGNPRGGRGGRLTRAERQAQWNEEARLAHEAILPHVAATQALIDAAIRRQQESGQPPPVPAFKLPVAPAPFVRTPIKFDPEVPTAPRIDREAAINRTPDGFVEPRIKIETPE